MLLMREMVEEDGAVDILVAFLGFPGDDGMVRWMWGERAFGGVPDQSPISNSGAAIGPAAGSPAVSSGLLRTAAGWSAVGIRPPAFRVRCFT